MDIRKGLTRLLQSSSDWNSVFNKKVEKVKWLFTNKVVYIKEKDKEIGRPVANTLAFLVGYATASERMTQKK